MLRLRRWAAGLRESKDGAEIAVDRRCVIQPRRCVRVASGRRRCQSKQRICAFLLEIFAVIAGGKQVVEVDVSTSCAQSCAAVLSTGGSATRRAAITKLDVSLFLLALLSLFSLLAVLAHFGEGGRIASRRRGSSNRVK